LDESAVAPLGLLLGEAATPSPPRGLAGAPVGELAPPRLPRRGLHPAPSGEATPLCRELPPMPPGEAAPPRTTRREMGPAPSDEPAPPLCSPPDLRLDLRPWGELG